MDCSLPGFSVHGILQARKLEWVAMPSSGGSSPPRYWTWFFHISGKFFTIWATRPKANVDVFLITFSKCFSFLVLHSTASLQKEERALHWPCSRMHLWEYSGNNQSHFERLGLGDFSKDCAQPRILTERPPLNWEGSVLCLVAQSCPTLCDPMGCSPPGSSVYGILQARVLEWVATSSPR